MIEQIREAVAARRAELQQQLAALDRAEHDLGLAFGLGAPAAPIERTADEPTAVQPPTPPEAQQSAAKVCGVCGGWFKPRKPWAKYCPGACQKRAVADRAKHAYRRKVGLIEDPKQDPEPLPDQVDRPFNVGEFEDAWLKETLKPPRLNIELPSAQ